MRLNDIVFRIKVMNSYDKAIDRVLNEGFNKCYKKDLQEARTTIIKKLMLGRGRYMDSVQVFSEYLYHHIFGALPVNGKQHTEYSLDYIDEQAKKMVQTIFDYIIIEQKEVAKNA